MKERGEDFQTTDGISFKAEYSGTDVRSTRYELLSTLSGPF